MIIDSHFHLVGEGWIHRDFFLGMARMALAPAAKLTGERADPAGLVDALMPVLSDTTGEKRVAAMDAAGVDATVVFAVDYGLATGEPGVSIEEQNRLIAEAARRFPGRLVPFFTVDPRRPGGLEMFRRAVEEWGMSGLKLHPTSGYYPYEDCCYPYYRACLEYGVPLLFHTGSQPAPLKFRYSLPVYVDDVAADFPDLTIIMAHVAHSLWKEALLVAEVKPNVLVDISGWQITFNHHPEEFYTMLRRLLDDLGPWRVLFGTDGPYLDVLCPLDRWLDALRRPEEHGCPENISFSEEEKEIVLGRAAARLLGSALHNS